MAKFRVWARCIDYVYLDVEAEDKEQALAFAFEMDGGDFHNGGGDWEWGDIDELNPDAEVDYEHDYVSEITGY